jgi:tetratricopeptide (TPR) repeat protein
MKAIKIFWGMGMFFVLSVPNVTFAQEPLVPTPIGAIILNEQKPAETPQMISKEEHESALKALELDMREKILLAEERMNDKGFNESGWYLNWISVGLFILEIAILVIGVLFAFLGLKTKKDFDDFKKEIEEFKKTTKKDFEEQQKEIEGNRYLSEANFEYSKENYERATELYDKCLEIDPKLAMAFHNKGVALGKLGRLGEAISAFDSAIAIDPKYAMAFNNKGITLGKLGRHEEEIVAYDSAIAIDPKYAMAFYNKGITLKELEKYEEAILAFDSAIAIDPKDAMAFYNRACAYALSSENEKQIQSDLAHAIELDSKSKEEAKNDKDFAKWNNKKWFRELVGDESEKKKK